jgi:hypothetical protein
MKILPDTAQPSKHLSPPREVAKNVAAVMFVGVAVFLLGLWFQNQWIQSTGIICTFFGPQQLLQDCLIERISLPTARRIVVIILMIALLITMVLLDGWMQRSGLSNGVQRSILVGVAITAFRPFFDELYSTVKEWRRKHGKQAAS